jgi:YHS domain-containing protein
MMINNFKRGDWTSGLSTMSANALKGHGFKSKEDVIDAFNKGLIYIKPNGGGSTVYSLGKIGIAEVKAWIGMDFKAKNNKDRIKSLPDVFMLASLVQFKYIQDISEPNDTNFKVSMAGGHYTFGSPSQYDEFMDKYLTWLERRKS